MERAGQVPELPQAMAGTGVSIEYVSSLAQAQAQRSVATGGIERFVSFAGRAAAMKPDVMYFVAIRRRLMSKEA
jgi:hypothetical protein